MLSSKSLTSGFAAVALVVFGGSAMAQTPAPSGDTTVKGQSMAAEKPKMSTTDTTTLKKCKAMPAAAMASDSKCKAFMTAHPDTAGDDKAAPADKPK